MSIIEYDVTVRIEPRAPSWGLSPTKRKSSAALMAYWVREYRADQVRHHPSRFRTNTLKTQILSG